MSVLGMVVVLHVMHAPVFMSTIVVMNFYSLRIFYCCTFLFSKKNAKPCLSSR